MKIMAKKPAQSMGNSAGKAGTETLKSLGRRRNAAGRADVGAVGRLDRAMDTELAFGSELLGRGIVDKTDTRISRTEVGACHGIVGLGGEVVPQQQTIAGGAEAKLAAEVGDDPDVRRKVRGTPPGMKFFRRKLLDKNDSFARCDHQTRGDYKGIG